MTSYHTEWLELVNKRDQFYLLMFIVTGTLFLWYRLYFYRWVSLAAATPYMTRVASLATSGGTVHRMIVLLIIAAGLRLWRIDAAFWYDELFSVWLANLPPERLILATLGDVHPPGYYFILAGLRQLVGNHQEWFYRSPSLVAGLAIIPLIYRLARAAFDERTAWTAAIITSLAPFQIYYSQEARMYALLTLAFLLAVLGMVERRLWLVVVGSLVALYLHNVAPVFIASLFLAAFIVESVSLIHTSLYMKVALGVTAISGGGYRIPSSQTAMGSRTAKNDDSLEGFRFLLMAGSLIALGFLPGMVTAIAQAGAVGSGFWIPPLNNVGRLFATFDDLLFYSPDNPLVIFTAISSGTALILIVTQLRNFITSKSRLFLFSVALIAVFVVTTVSFLWQSILISRVMAPIAPLFYILLAWSITRSRRRAILWGSFSLVLVIGVMISPWFNPYAGRQAVDREMLDFWGDYQPGDAIFHVNVSSYVIWSYYRDDTPQYVWAQFNDLTQTLTPQTKTAMGMQEAYFDDVACNAPRWWVITYNNPTTAPSELAYVDELVQTYQPHTIPILSEAGVDVNFYRIDASCQK